MGLQKRVGLHSFPYVGLIATLIGLIWGIAIAIGTTMIVLTMFRKNMPLNRVGLVGLGLIIFGLIVLRSAIHLLIEAGSLYVIVGERQHYRWANSFHKAEGSQRNGILASTHFSYQYRPWWLALLLSAGAITFFITGLWFPIMLWVTVPGAALLLETILRVGLKILYLRTRLGAATKNFTLRWLPWLSIPVRQFQHNDTLRHAWDSGY